jgi:hypothetical protein
MNAGFPFVKTSNDSGFPVTSPLPIGLEAWYHHQN